MRAFSGQYCSTFLRNGVDAALMDICVSPQTRYFNQAAFLACTQDGNSPDAGGVGDVTYT